MKKIIKADITYTAKTQIGDNYTLSDKTSITTTNKDLLNKLELYDFYVTLCKLSINIYHEEYITPDSYAICTSILKDLKIITQSDIDKNENLIKDNPDLLQKGINCEMLDGVYSNLIESLRLEINEDKDVILNIIFYTIEF